MILINNNFNILEELVFNNLSVLILSTGLIGGGIIGVTINLLHRRRGQMNGR